MNVPPLGRTQSIALANIVSLALGLALHADSIEAPERETARLETPRLDAAGLETARLETTRLETPKRVLLADEFANSSHYGEGPSDRFATSFGIRKSRGVQLVRPIEVNNQEYELNLSGPVVKSGTKKKFFGLNFEVRF